MNLLLQVFQAHLPPQELHLQKAVTQFGGIEAVTNDEALLRQLVDMQRIPSLKEEKESRFSDHISEADLQHALELSCVHRVSVLDLDVPS